MPAISSRLSKPRPLIRSGRPSGASYGAMVIVVLLFAFVLSAITMVLMSQGESRTRLAGQTYHHAVVLHLAEAGVEKMRWQLNSSASSHALSEQNVYQHRGYAGGFVVSAEARGDGFRVESRAQVGRDKQPALARCQLTVDLERIEGKLQVADWHEQYHWK